MNKFSLQILDFIKETAHSLEEFVTTPYGTYSLRPRSSYYTALRRMERKNLVTKTKQGRVVRYTITAKGKRLIKNPYLKVRRTDGNSSFIIFDIPESLKRERTAFRRYLQNHGYTLLQKSVLVSPDEIPVELIDLINELKLKKYITFLSGKVDRI